MHHIDRYEQGVAAARRRFHDDPAVRLIQDPAIGASHLEAFLIHYCALGVAMTEPVEDWIRRAGEACVRAGFDKLGRALRGHAKAEADYHLLMITDLGRLCDRRAAAGRVAPKPSDMLALRWPESTQHYRRMREDVIAGPHPYAQIAIENEIGLLSVDLGPRLLDNARGLLGNDILDDLSFLTDHITLGVGRTKLNRRQLAAFLDMQDKQGRVDDVLDALVPAGSDALDAYRAFVSDCVSLSSRVSSGSHFSLTSCGS